MESRRNIQNPKNGMAIASMVCGICSLVFYIFFIGFPLAIIAVILGHVQLSNVRKKPKTIFFDSRDYASSKELGQYDAQASKKTAKNQHIWSFWQNLGQFETFFLTF